jgi:Ulp1 family protease
LQFRSILNDLVEQQKLQAEFTEGFTAVENFDVPQQDNGTDCGIFSL